MALALYEGIGVLGIVLALMGEGKNVLIGFFGVSGIAMLTARPKLDHLREHQSKTLRARHTPEV